MIDHLGITASSLDASKAFYSATVQTLGYVVRMNRPGAVSFGICLGSRQSTDPGGDFWLSKGMPASPRVHFAFHAASPSEVDAFFAVGLAAGGTGNGEPGLRPHYHPRFYAAFLLDPDGDLVEAVCHSG
jgi:catechol 2,3-dioxygenase-like lactoylglutathione lyase family enzyme